MADIEIAAGVFALGMRAVGRQAESRAEVPIRADIIERMRVGVAGDESEMVIFASGESGLQSVVVRFVVVGHLIDVLQERECGVEWPRSLLGAAVGSAVAEAGSLTRQDRCGSPT